MSVIMPLELKETVHEDLKKVGEAIVNAKELGAPVVLMMGAHVLRSGVQRYLIDLMEGGYISCFAVNGACAIHDFEFALIGKTTESVPKYISNGRFGLWKETGFINDIVRHAAEKDMGLGESLGREIFEGEYPHKDISIFAAAYRFGIPLTVHVGIGYDIVHEHPNCDGAAWGKTTYIDFLCFAKVLESLESGVVMNFGSSVMAPEVFLKALAMVRNVAAQENRCIRNFTTLVCDLRPLPEDYRICPSKQNPDYYFRPWKTMLVRTLDNFGRGHYVQAPHRQTVSGLWTAMQNLIKSSERESSAPNRTM